MLDGSLDRTNVICEIFSAAVIERFMSTTNPQWLNIPQLWAAHSNIWADNGDLLSKYMSSLVELPNDRDQAESVALVLN